MDRTIKFRAWDTNKKAWKGLWIFRGGHNGEYDVSNKEIDVLDLTNRWGSDVVLMQFTGLYDCEGKEVWEGDVIEYTQHHFNTELIKVKRKVVKWKYDRWNIYETAAGETDIKVLGNLYEHPDLLNNER